MDKLLIENEDILIPIKIRYNKTSIKIKENLPFSGSAYKWDKEYYFYTFLIIEPESDAKDVIEKGEIPYWPKINAIAIAYGPTPVSIKNEIKPASKCSIWADTNYNLDKLDNIKSKDILIRVFYA